jgi:hypothetical protein
VEVADTAAVDFYIQTIGLSQRDSLAVVEAVNFVLSQALT